MSLQNKYFKYKNKYLNLKNQFGNGKSENEIIEELKLKEKQAHALTYTEVINVTKLNSQNIIQCKNILSGEIFNVTCEQVVYALGPFTDRFLKNIPMYNWSDVLLPSKGSHLWISYKDLPLKYPIVITTKDDRVIFVIPHGNQILIGTTEVDFNGDYFDVLPSEKEINYLLSALNDYFPKIALNHSHILSSFAGIRPLIREAGGDRGKTSREHKIFQPMSDTYVIAGGKYTTFRVIGQDITREICHKYGRSYNSNQSKQSLRQKSIVLPLDWKVPSRDELLKICETEYPKTFNDLIVRRLSIPSKKIWIARAGGIDFNEYFLNHIDDLKKYINITKEDITSFN